MGAREWLHTLNVGDKVYYEWQGYEESMEVLEPVHKKGEREYVRVKRPHLKAIKTLCVEPFDDTGVFVQWSMKYSAQWCDLTKFKVVKPSKNV